MFLDPDMIGNLLIFTALFSYIWDPFGWFGDTEEDTVADVPEPPDLPPADSDEPVQPGSSLVLTNADDELTSGSGDDIIYGMGGNDVLEGGAGDDVIEGNTGDDVVSGQEGNDVIAGGSGADILLGGDGNDVISSDRMDSDADFARGDAETLSGGTGDDRLIFSSGDTATGGEGVDDFDLVVVSGEEPAQIQDFDDATETITIYYESADPTDPPPEMTFSQDADNNNSSILLDGVEVAQFSGLIDFTDTNMSLARVEDLDFDIVDDSGISIS